MDDIINHFENLIISCNMNENNIPNNNNSNMEQRNFIMQNLRMVHPFGGHKDELATYIKSVESVIPNITLVPHDDRVLFFNSILRTLHDQALNVVRRERPTDWTALKAALIDEFGEHQPISQLILSINNIKFKSGCKLLCDEINKTVCRINDAIELCSETEERKLFFRNEANFCSLNVLKRELPVYLTALLNANLVTDFKSGVKILRENNEIDSDNYFKPKKNRNFFQNNVRPQIVNNEFRNLVTPNSRYPIPFRSPQNNYQPYFQNPQNNYQPYFQNPQNNFQLRPRNNSQNPCQNYQNGFQDRNNSCQNNFRNTDSNYRNNTPNPKRRREEDSNQSRLRKFGVPVPMEVENFHSIASNHFPPS